jgi:hypothetical protein
MDIRARAHRRCVKERERPLLGCERCARGIGRALNRRHPIAGQDLRPLRAIADAHLDQGVCKPGHAETNAPFRHCLVTLRGQGIVRDVDHIVEEAHGKGGALLDPRRIDRRLAGEGRRDELRQIDRS